MTTIKINNDRFKVFVVFLLVLLIQPTHVFAKNTDCWVDLFDETQYKGSKTRVSGPAKLKVLSDINGEDWDKRIESTIVGSKATLTVFENKRFKLTLTEMAKHPVLMKSLGISKQDILEESELIFGPNSRIHGFGEFRFYHKIRSLIVECQ